MRETFNQLNILPKPLIISHHQVPFLAQLAPVQLKWTIFWIFTISRQEPVYEDLCEAGQVMTHMNPHISRKIKQMWNFLFGWIYAWRLKSKLKLVLKFDLGFLYCPHDMYQLYQILKKTVTSSLAHELTLISLQIKLNLDIFTDSLTDQTNIVIFTDSFTDIFKDQTFYIFTDSRNVIILHVMIEFRYF